MATGTIKRNGNFETNTQLGISYGFIRKDSADAIGIYLQAQANTLSEGNIRLLFTANGIKLDKYSGNTWVNILTVS